MKTTQIQKIKTPTGDSAVTKRLSVELIPWHNHTGSVQRTTDIKIQ